MRDAQAQAAAELLQDRLELLRLRVLLVGALGILLLIVSWVAVLGYASQASSLFGQVWTRSADALHVPSDLFQAPSDLSWARTPVLLQIAFVAIGMAGIFYMTRQVLSTVQVRVWGAVLFILALCIVYTQWDTGSVWQSAHRNLVKAVKAKEWARVEQLSLDSRNALGHQYVMAQVGLLKPDAALAQLHGKPLVDQINGVLLSGVQQGFDVQIDGGRNVLKAADKFEPKVLKSIDLAVYGAPHTEIGIALSRPGQGDSQGSAGPAWALVRALLATLAALAGVAAAIAVLMLWRRMARRLRWLGPWVAAAS